MSDKHNAKVSEPILNELLEKLGEGWEINCCLNDSCASIHKHFKNDQWISIYVPNATEPNPSQEEYTNFGMNISDEYFPQYDTIERVIEVAKENEKDFQHDELQVLVQTPIKTKPQAVIYIGRLHELNCGYHMDDDATEIVDARGNQCFGERLGKLANKRADECFELLTNDEYCPHAVGLACFMD
tara:strand:+ start:205 stop:759 length:555 start_codon:yes stop_codon:yes gene_type:complete